jgi:hypothetical protein
MSLLTRLIDPLPGEEKLPIHAFQAGIAEFKRGHVTAPQFFAAFNLSASEQTQMTTWFTTGNTERLEVHDILLLGESGLYDLNACKTRLGI